VTTTNALNGECLIDNVQLSVSSPEEMMQVLAEHDYLADDSLATALFLAIRLERPLLLEGDAGAGKTEVASVLACWIGGELIRLQCYDGIDASQAVYEWDYARQLLHLRAAETTGTDCDRARTIPRFRRVFNTSTAVTGDCGHGGRRTGANTLDRRDRPSGRRIRGVPPKRYSRISRSRCRRLARSRRSVHQ
jgi:hypothetical protein